MKRAAVRKLLASRKNALAREGQRLIHQRPPNPVRKWRTAAPPGKVTTRPATPEELGTS